jgi:hypothetical protein
MEVIGYGNSTNGKVKDKGKYKPIIKTLWVTIWVMYSHFIPPLTTPL